MEEPKKKSSLVATQFSDLPSCLVMDVLLRLPLTSLLTCRRVCEDWFRLFQDPYFIKLQLAASPTHILTLDMPLDGPPVDETIFMFGEVVEDTTEEEEDLVVEKIVNYRVSRVLGPSERCFYLHSCHGLLCFLNYGILYVTSVCVCNPILDEWVTISVRDRIPYTSINIALVFDAKNNQYKLLHGFRTLEKDYAFEIYTLGGSTRQWRSIDERLVCSRSLGEALTEAAFIHGSLHWIDPDTLGFIHCLDVDSEKFGRRLSLPSRGQGKSSISSDTRLGVINGCLCVLYSNWIEEDDDDSDDDDDYDYDYDDDVEILTDVEIWCMKEYGVEKSWIKMLTFDAPSDGSRIVPPLSFFSMNEEEILMYDRGGWLLNYNLRKTRLSHYQLETGYVIYDAEYKRNFVSLYQVAKGEEVKSLLRSC